MVEFKSFRNQLYKLNNVDFEALVWQAFDIQSKNNLIYKKYIQHLNIDPDKIKQISDIPFLPISFFKTHNIKTGNWDEEMVFESSGTTGAVTSRHFLDDLDFYYEHSLKNFEYFYGDPADYHILGLLPSYLERENSSLVHMVEYLMQVSNSHLSGFYLYNYDELYRKLYKINALLDDKRRILLFGITFALLELGEQKAPSLLDAIVIETGGMKGRRKEMIREELHNQLETTLKLSSVHSEYGMTELLSQAYSSGEGKFKTPPWMKVMVRDLNDPFTYTNGTGAINIIDLANIHSCSFIETQDVGKINGNGTFEVMGRIDYSDIRGCNLLWN
ncbi:MAG: acyl transferase [Candidatus Cyclobacteriaceae bacterium M2_1C_046]